jgi:hypothetical protein
MNYERPQIQRSSRLNCLALCRPSTAETCRLPNLLSPLSHLSSGVAHVFLSTCLRLEQIILDQRELFFLQNAQRKALGVGSRGLPQGTINCQSFHRKKVRQLYMHGTVSNLVLTVGVVDVIDIDLIKAKIGGSQRARLPLALQ